MKSTFRYFVLLYFVTFMIEAARDGKHFRCDYTYFPKAEGWLKLHLIASTWNEARARCHLEGAVLASPLTPGLTDAIRNVSVKNLITDLHTGIHATYSKRVFSSIEGVPLSQIMHQSQLVWHTPLSKLRDEENCLSLVPGDTYMSLFGSERSSKRPYMCYKKLNESLVVNKCGTVDNEYSLEESTLSCYKVHRVRRPWADAYLTCEAEGGYLLIINSEDEALIAIRNINISKSFGFFAGYTVLDDFYSLPVTIHGQTLRETGYEFAPDRWINGTEKCGSVNYVGRVEYVDCFSVKFFICEKSPFSLLCEDDDHSNTTNHGAIIDNTLQIDEWSYNSI